MRRTKGEEAKRIEYRETREGWFSSIENGGAVGEKLIVYTFPGERGEAIGMRDSTRKTSSCI